MSDEARAWAKRQRGLSVAEKSVLNALAGYADADGEAFPKISTLAEVTAMSGRHVQRQLGKLEDRGLLQRFERMREGDGGQTSNLYRFAMPRDQLVGGEGDADVTHRTKSPPARRGRHAPVTMVSPLKNLIEDGCSDEQPSADDAEFNRISKAFADHKANPRPAVARRAWRATGESPISLAAAADRYLAESPDIRRGQATWLHAWLEDPDNWRPYLPTISSEADGTRTAFAGPAEVRLAFAEDPRLGESWARSYLDRAGWEGATKSILPATATALRELQMPVPSEILKRLKCQLGEGGR